MAFPLPGANWTYLHTLTLKATTPMAGYALQNATGTFLSWQVPNDGKNHRAIAICNTYIAATETGGGIACNWTLPNGSTVPLNFSGGGQSGPSLDYSGPQAVEMIVQPGTTITIAQFSPLTAGAATTWAEIWGF